MKTKYLLFVILISCLAVSCSDKTKFEAVLSNSVRGPEYKNLDKIIKKNFDKNGNKFGLKLVIDSVTRKYRYSTNYKLLKDGTFDFAVITNTNYLNKDSADYDFSNIKSVLPINSRIFYIAYNKEKIKPESLVDLFEGKNVAILGNETAFIKKILTDFGVEINKVNFQLNKSNIGDEDTNKMDQATKDSISKLDFFNAYKTNKPLPYDVEIGFSSHNFSGSGRIYKFLNGHPEFTLYSLDDYQLFKNGSKAEGFCLRNKYFTPFLLPKGAFGDFPQEPILTFREDFILAARDDVDEEFIYNIVKVAIEETDLIDMKMYGQSFENISFAFPLHEGTKRYLDKNAPKFYEKYGELLGKIGAGIGGIYTAFMGFLIWRKKRRRKSITVDYERVLEIQKKLTEKNSKEELEAMYNELQVIENYYHLKMIDQKILVDESLQIFFVTIDKIEGYILKELRLVQNTNN